MKAKILTFVIYGIALAFLASCEGPTGPAGPAGPAGAAGPAGPAGNDGTPGVAGYEQCLACHSSDNKYRVTMEYEESGHASGSTAARGGSGTCAPCHSNEGFIEVSWTGEDRATGFGFPTRVGCTTCHSWHNESFEIADTPDFALRTVAAVDLLMFRDFDLPAQSIDLGDNGNLCVSCHQARRSFEGYLTTDDNLGDGTYDQGGTHFGAHHSAQGPTLMGIGGADVGTTAMPSGPDTHGNLATCITCHMDERNHEFEPSLDACNAVGCHSTAPVTSLDKNQRQLDFEEKVEELEDALLAAGLLHYEKDTVWKDHHEEVIVSIDSTIEQKPGIYPVGHVGALYNYDLSHADNSHGLHNFDFMEDLMTKSLEALE